MKELNELLEKWEKLLHAHRCNNERCVKEGNKILAAMYDGKCAVRESCINDLANIQPEINELERKNRQLNLTLDEVSESISEQAQEIQQLKAENDKLKEDIRILIADHNTAIKTVESLAQVVSDFKYFYNKKNQEVKTLKIESENGGNDE